MLNHFRKISFLIALLLTGSYAFSQVYNTTRGIINFRSDAPLELIKATSTDMRGILDAGRKAFAFTVKIKTFEGFNSPLQKEHFNENYLESSRFPNASFSGKIIEDIDFSKNGTYTVRAKGNLSIHGVQQERIIKSTVVVDNGKLTITSNFTVQLSEHNIPIPKVVHEKLASEINVEVIADMISP